MRNLFLLLSLVLFSVAVTAAEQDKQFGKTADVTLTGCGMAVKGKTLFATAGSAAYSKEKALYAIDISVPEKPQVISSVELKNGFPQDVAILDDLVLVVDGMRLYAIDVKDPKNMKIVSELTVSDDPVKGPQSIHALNLLGKRAVLSCRAGGIVHVSLENPLKPEVTSRIATEFARDCAVTDVNNESAPVNYVADDVRGIKMFDDSDMAESVVTDGGCASGIIVSGNVLYLANGTSPLAIYEIGADGKLTLKGQIKKFDGAHFYGTNCYDVKVSGKTAFLAAGETGIAAVDVSDISNPKVIGFCREIFFSGVKSLAVADKIIYANDNGSQVFTVDVSDPANMKLLPVTIQLRK